MQGIAFAMARKPEVQGPNRRLEQIPDSRNGGATQIAWCRVVSLSSQPVLSCVAIVYIQPLLRDHAALGFAPCGQGESVDYTRFEKARIVGARALQLSMGAPPLIETPADVRNPVRVAMLEYEASAIPLTVKRSATHQVKQ